MDRNYRYHMTTTPGGNLSMRDPDGSIWITPSRVDKGSLRPDDVVRVRADGKREGLHPPSSEFPFHREIYKCRPAIKAIGGRDLSEAFQRVKTLESVAQTVIRASALGESKTLAADSLAGQAVPDFAELPAAVPTNREKELRAQVSAFAQSAYRQRLMIGRAGSISARLDERRFVITPRRRDLKPASLVRATPGAAEAGKRASRTSRLHGLIYAANPEVGVIINAQPICTSAFCMTGAEFSSRTIPESYLVLGDAPKVTFACVVNAAEALQLSRPLGPLAPMPESALAESRKAFGLE